MSFTFKFNKTKAPSKLQPRASSIVTEEEEKSTAKKDFVTSIENNEVKTVNPVKEKSPLVIPLIQNNVWRAEKRKKTTGITETSRTDSSTTNSSSLVVEENVKKSRQDESLSKEESLEEKAKRELLSEAQAYTDTAQETASTSKRTIPILLVNKVPEGYEEDANFDVSLRPDKPTQADYERVPVSEFGMAMLRGMGFDEKKAESITPVEVKIRPKGLGLGADMPPEKKNRNEETKQTK